MKFLTVSVVFSFFSCIAFTVAVIVLETHDVMISDTLIQYFFMTFGLEFGASAAIKIAKYITKKQEVKDKVENIVNNNLPIDKNDLDSSNDDDDFDDGTYYG